MFVTFTGPLYGDIRMAREEAGAYKEALGNSKALENERDKLTQKYNAIDSIQLSRLEKMIPENVDNIRLILEIEKIAMPYGMVLKGVKYDSAPKKEEGAVTSPAIGVSENPDYGTWTLEFSTSSTYANFISFLKDLERNLRIVDVSELSFASDADISNQGFGTYKFDFKIKTYWLKN